MALLRDPAMLEEFGGMVPRGGWTPAARKARAEPHRPSAAKVLVRTIGGPTHFLGDEVDVSRWEPNVPGEGVTLLELRRTSCRFPLPGATGAAIRFCGEEAVEGSSWCERCGRVAVWRPPQTGSA